MNLLTRIVVGVTFVFVLQCVAFGAAIAPVCVTNSSAAGSWAQNGTPSSCGATQLTTAGGDPGLPAVFFLPEPAAETGLEPVGDFVFNRMLVATPGFFTIVQAAAGGTSDWIVFGNGLTANAAANQGEVLFFSDPNSPANLPGFPASFTNDGVLCTEGGPGCIGTFALSTTAGELIQIDAASDGDTRPFNPFGIATDVTDAIRFTVIPEPTTLALSGGALVVLAWVGLRRRAERIKQTMRK